MLFAIAGLVIPMSVRADADVFIDEDVVVEESAADAEQNSADAVAAYNVSGSLFQQITDLEQEKVLMQLEKERAQLNLEIDRLAAEKIKLHMEIDALSGRAEQQQAELETAMAQLEAENARLEREKAAMESAAENAEVSQTPSSFGGYKSSSKQQSSGGDLVNEYRLVNVVGAGNQLQATIQDLTTGQNKKLSVGKKLGEYTVKSISLDDGVVFAGPDGDIQTLNVGGNE